VETATSLARVVNYVHLNPVEAHLVTAEQITTYRWSSLHYFLQRQMPAVLTSKDWLTELAAADVSDIGEYVLYLQKLAKDRAEQKRQGWDGMNHGWAIGTQGWREALAKDYKQLALARATEAKANAESCRQQWESVLAEILRETGKSREDLAGARKGAPWKLVLALELRRRTTASCTWIAPALSMGTAASLRQYISRHRRRTLRAPSQSCGGNSHVAT
jgi:putative transposase